MRLLDPKGGPRPAERAGFAGKSEGESGSGFSSFLVLPSCVTLGKPFLSAASVSSRVK